MHETWLAVFFGYAPQRIVEIHRGFCILLQKGEMSVSRKRSFLRDEM